MCQTRCPKRGPAALAPSPARPRSRRCRQCQTQCSGVEAIMASVNQGELRRRFTACGRHDSGPAHCPTVFPPHRRKPGALSDPEPSFSPEFVAPQYCGSYRSVGIDVWVAGAFMYSHIRMRCRLCVAGTAFAVGPSYVMYLGHILL